MLLKRANFPVTRMRRLRQQGFLRDLVRETQLGVNDLIYPLFIQEGQNLATPIAAMPGVARLSPDLVLQECSELVNLGIPAIALFPHIDPSLKTPAGDYAYDADGLVPRVVALIKANYPQLGVICDVALDPYTSHGHDGILDAAGNIDNDASLQALARQALVLAAAGADVVAPSDMMDGRIGKIRAALDAANFTQVCILAYSAKYASNYYGPFRHALGSNVQLGNSDKRSYQMDYGNTDEALHEASLDIQEGADMVMVKPGGAYLDIVQRISSTFLVPTLVYQVSGEYSMLQLAFREGLLKERETVLETLSCMKRAGACAILTYFAKKAAIWLHD